ncbi:sensor histidine kinase [Novosphingobium sp.]|uniref:sensor histidine kinase n=1 Tax=Novosphingobium sp. TaxID=1874826 RepID=UPI002FE2444D
MNRPARFPTRFLERFPLIPERPLVRYGATVALCLLAFWIRWVLDEAFPPGYPYLTFFPAVILSSFLFGPRPGIVAALICGLFAWCVFIPPRFGFAFDYRTLVSLAFYLGVVVVDIALVHLMQRANARLHLAREEVRKLAEERGVLAERTELLFQELQHRVGNNLQMIGAVLSLQMRGLEEPIARRAIANAAGRLQVIGRIQRRLYQTDGELVPLDRFVHDLSEQVMDSSGRETIVCHVAVESGIVLRPDAAVPVALILSEAIANALEHGLATQDSGLIRIDVRRHGEEVSLTVEDDGIGLPPGFEPDQAESIGLRISRVLSRQLEARLILENVAPESGRSGARMRLHLPPCRVAAAGQGGR